MIKKLIGYQDIAMLLNDKLSDYVKNKISEYKLGLLPSEKKKKKQVIIKIIDTLLDPFLIYSGPHRLKQWEKAGTKILKN